MWNNYNSQYPSFNNNYSNTSPYQVQQQYRPTVTNSSTYQNLQAGQAQNNIIWVNGRENARSMQLQPNSTVILLDNETNKFYIKTTDNIGLGKIRVFNYTEEIDTPSEQNPSISQVDLSNYVTKEQLQKILVTLKGEKEKENDQSISTAKQPKQPIIIKKQ